MRSRFVVITLLLVSFLFCKPVWAEEFSPHWETVEEVYLLQNNKFGNSKDELKKMALIYYFTGIKEHEVIRLQEENKKASDCINKPVTVWFDPVFDEYKHNRIKGNNPFFPYFIGVINDICNVDLWGVNKEEKNKKISRLE